MYMYIHVYVSNPHMNMNIAPESMQLQTAHYFSMVRYFLLVKLSYKCTYMYMLLDLELGFTLIHS